MNLYRSNSSSYQLSGRASTITYFQFRAANYFSVSRGAYMKDDNLILVEQKKTTTTILRCRYGSIKMWSLLAWVLSFWSFKSLRCNSQWVTSPKKMIYSIFKGGGSSIWSRKFGFFELFLSIGWPGRKIIWPWGFFLSTRWSFRQPLYT